MVFIFSCNGYWNKNWIEQLLWYLTLNEYFFYYGYLKTHLCFIRHFKSDLYTLMLKFLIYADNKLN